MSQLAWAIDIQCYEEGLIAAMAQALKHHTEQLMDFQASWFQSSGVEAASYKYLCLCGLLVVLFQNLLHGLFCFLFIRSIEYPLEHLDNLKWGCQAQ